VEIARIRIFRRSFLKEDQRQKSLTP